MKRTKHNHDEGYFVSSESTIRLELDASKNHIHAIDNFPNKFKDQISSKYSNQCFKKSI